jgi:hypothetical protein
VVVIELGPEDCWTALMFPVLIIRWLAKVGGFPFEGHGLDDIRCFTIKN